MCSFFFFLGLIQKCDLTNFRDRRFLEDFLIDKR